jgi:glucose dehydrogenase
MPTDSTELCLPMHLNLLRDEHRAYSRGSLVRCARFLGVAAATLACVTGASAQAGAQGGEWRGYGGDAGHTRYAALDQIDATNVAQLKVAWRWNARNFGYNPNISSSTTPLMVNGVLYATAGVRRAVVAIDAGTGETLWTWAMDEGERLRTAPRANPGRGVAYWEDEAGRGRILVVTPGYHLAALDALTGRPVDGFGDAGVVDLMKGHRARDGVSLVGTIGASSPPTVVGNMVVVGSAHHVGLRPPSMTNTPGDVRGFDAETGELAWTFKTIPEAGEPGNESWEEDSWTYTGNAAVWAPISSDAETGYVYLPTEAATGDYYGGHRPGNNLFSTSLVCLDGRTGEVIWHFQTIHHDIWDWDNPTAPILADLTIDGRPTKIVAQITKQGFVFVFDRITGDPIWPIEERAVPASDVPGERAAPTQPFPTKPAPFDRQGFSEDDLLDFTPKIRARAAAVAADYRMGPLYTPPSLAAAADGTKGTLSLPYSTGGANWEGGALDPETGMLYIGSQTNTMVLAMVEGGDRSDMRYILGGGRAQVAPGVPIVKPPWGRITAIDLTTGDHSWMIANGDTPPNVATRLGLDPADIPRTGKASRAGILATKTLLFAGEGMSGDPIFRAHDKRTGEIIAAIPLPNAQVGLPMTYMHEGRQYVVISVGGGGEPAELVALALPRS